MEPLSALHHEQVGRAGSYCARRLFVFDRQGDPSIRQRSETQTGRHQVLRLDRILACDCLITPAYFAKYFAEDGRLNLEGELGLILGIIALWALSLPAITTLPMMPKAIGGMRWKRSQRMGYVCLILVVAHMVALGLRGWLSPEHWPWMLPPISLVAAIIAMIPLVVKFMK
jgi:hypothetical protein